MKPLKLRFVLDHENAESFGPSIKGFLFPGNKWVRNSKYIKTEFFKGRHFYFRYTHTKTNFVITIEIPNYIYKLNKNKKSFTLNFSTKMYLSKIENGKKWLYHRSDESEYVGIEPDYMFSNDRSLDTN